MTIPKLDYYWQYVEYWSTKDPSFPALREGERTVTSKDFWDRSIQLAKVLLSFGVKKEDRIVTILPTSIEFTLVLVASEMVGAILVPMDLKFRIADLERFLSHAKPRLIVGLTHVKDFNIAEALSSLGEEFKDIKKITVGAKTFGASFEDLFVMKPDNNDELDKRKSTLSPEDGALIVFSGGTTGVPKAALLNHTNQVFMSYLDIVYLNKHVAAEGVTQRFKTIASLPPSHVGGTVEFIGAGIVGGLEMILIDPWNPYTILELTEKERVPWIGGVPTMYAIILGLPDLKKFDLSSLKIAILSGEKVSVELLRETQQKIAPKILIGFGSTEAGAEVTFTDVNEDFDKLADGYVGKPIGGMQIKIIDKKGRELPAGEQGEIITKGPLTIKGYWNMPEEDKVGFTKDGWCRTGDLGNLTKDGGLYVKGRIKHIIRVGGYTVMPTEVEEVALEYPNVGLPACIGVPNKIYGEEVWLFVAPVWGTQVDIDGLMKHLESKLAKFKVPKKIIIKDDIPITRIGKADRTKLQKEVVAALEKEK
jgi:acyl-CoA synthetase (AMP-forming)/AMP-acid ligase II